MVDSLLSVNEGAEAMRVNYAILCVVVVVATACGNDHQEDTASQTGAAAPSPAVETPQTPPASTPAQTPPATPAAGPAPSCPSGASVDPPPNELEPPVAQGPVTPQARLNQLRYLMTRYPQSATIRVRAASMQLGPAPAGNPVEAQRLFQEALRLHDAGCRLPEELEWEANEGLGLAYMMQTSYAAALPVFQQVTSRWPTIPQSRYNLACAYCRLNQIDPCHQAFVEALQIAAANQSPAFITQETDAYHYVNLARQDPDLAPLRADPRFETAIAPYIRQP